MGEYINYFAIPETFFECQYYKNLTTFEKLFCIELLNQFNQAEEFYKSDFEFAAKFGVSTKTIQTARKKLKDFALLEFRAGGITKRKKYLATGYNYFVFHDDIKKINNGELEKRYSKIDRFTFEALIYYAATKKLTLEEVLTYIALFYIYDMQEGTNNFRVTKSKLSELTGLNTTTIVKCIEGLYKKILFNDNTAHLFEFKLGYHVIDIMKFSYWASPERGNNLWLYETMKMRIEKEKEKLINEKKAKNYKGLVRRFYEMAGKRIQTNVIEEGALKLAEIEGYFVNQEEIIKAMEWYLNNYCSSEKRTINKFVEYVKANY